MVDTVSQWFPPECNTCTNSSPPTTQPWSAVVRSVFWRPGVPYLVLRRVWAALMILSFSQDWLLSRTTLHEQKMKISKSLHASILFLMKYLSASYNFNSPHIIQSFGVLELHLRLVIMPFSSDSDSTGCSKGYSADCVCFSNASLAFKTHSHRSSTSE